MAFSGTVGLNAYRNVKSRSQQFSELGAQHPESASLREVERVFGLAVLQVEEEVAAGIVYGLNVNIGLVS